MLLLSGSCSENPSIGDSGELIINYKYKSRLLEDISAKISGLVNNRSTEGIELPEIKLIKDAYEKNCSYWMDDSLNLNKDGTRLLNIIQNILSYGIDSSYYNYTRLQIIQNSINNQPVIDKRRNLALNMEISLTGCYLLLSKQFSYGVVDSTHLISIIKRKPFDLDLVQILKKGYKENNLIGNLLNLQPNHPEYRRLQKGLANFVSKSNLPENKIKVPNFKKDSVKSYQKAAEALVLHGYLDSTITDLSDSLMSSLKKFQKDHGLNPDGIIGKNTAKSLSISPKKYYLQAAASLERWKWKNKWEDEYIFVNISSYKLKFYKNDSVKQTHRVVVGKNLTKTPEINSAIEYFITYPLWHVPYSITSGELVPKARKDSSYLARNGYQLIGKDKKLVDPSTVDWNVSTENSFRIRQKSGGENALGKIKFIFPNEHMVYLHDTPSKRFFANDIRAYSHGCMRVQDPVKLAEYLINRDENEYSLDSVTSFIENRIRKKIELNKIMPVHVHYFTCEGGDDNNIIFYPDIYGWDEKLINLMKYTKTDDYLTAPPLAMK